MLKKLIAKKEFCDKMYYDEGKPIMSDEEYDALVEKISDMKPSVNVDPLAGRKGKVDLPVKMWSLNKVRNYKKGDINCIMMDKLDGVSCLLYKKRAYTRGNGEQGHDITNMFRQIVDIPGFAIRGELVVDKKKLLPEFSNTRNMVCSYVTRNVYNDKVEFVAYELISLEGDDLSPSLQLKTLENNGLKVVYNRGPLTGNQQIFDNFLEERIKNSEYNIDGIVVSLEESRKARELQRNPKYAFAFKKEISGVLSRVIDLTYNVGRDGTYTPIIHIDPITISGSVIRKVNGHNVNYLKTKGIGINSLISVVKAGQVIPHIAQVVEKSENINLPKDCDEFGKCSSNVKSEVNDLLHFSKCLKIVGIGPAKAKELTEKGINPHSLLSDGIALLNNLSTGKVDDKIKQSITENLRNAEAIDILTGLSFFGVGVGKKRIQKMEIPESANAILLQWQKNWKN